MKYDLKLRIGHEDGWVVLADTGAPIAMFAFFKARSHARNYVKNCGFEKTRIVRCRYILAWKP